MEIKSKLPHVGTTIFTTMSALANEHGALNLGQGFPDFSMDKKLADLTHAKMLSGFNQYAPMQGVAELRKVLAQKIEKLYHQSFDWKDEITITAGGTQAIFTAISALVHEGDEVILFAPAYDCYAPAIVLAGAKPVWYELNYPDYSVQWDDVRKLITQRTRMIIINSPHNPTGKCFSENDMKELQTLLSDTDILVLSDEVYEHIIFDEKQHHSVCSYPSLRKRSLAVFSFGKTLHVTGWKLGYIVADASLMQEFRKVHQYNVFSVNTPMQWAIADYLQEEEVWKKLSQFYQTKRDLFLHHLKNSSFEIHPAEGTYFQLLNFRHLNYNSDWQTAVELTSTKGITGIPCSFFYPNKTDEGVLRFCFAKEDALLIKAADILCQLESVKA